MRDELRDKLDDEDEGDPTSSRPLAEDVGTTISRSGRLGEPSLPWNSNSCKDSQYNQNRDDFNECETSLISQ